MIAQVLEQIQCPVAEVDMNLYTSSADDQTVRPLNLLIDSENKITKDDAFSSSLRNFSQGLKSLSLRNVVINTQIFWPTLDLCDPLPPLRTPHWQYLEKIQIKHDVARSDGQWLFMRNPADPKPKIYIGRTGWRRCTFRSMAHPRMNDFYAAAALAAHEMPVLRQMKCKASPAQHGFTYSYKDEHGPAQATAHWGATPVFAPEERVMKLWKKVAQDIRGCDLTILIDEKDLCLY